MFLIYYHPLNIVNVLDDVDCENSGWGNTNQNGVYYPDELQVVITPIVNQETCELCWSIKQPPMHINDGNICSGDKNKGACNVRK